MTARNFPALCLLGLALSSVTPNASFADGASSHPGTEMSGLWQDRAAIMSHGPDGSVIHLYGQSQPTLECSPLHLCEIALQAGEVVNDVLVGDSVRWQIEAATSGSPEGQRVHLVVKPAEAGLATSMVVTTSRRTYHIALKSGQHGYMARMAFSYPQEIRQSIEAANQRLKDTIIPGAGVPAEQLNFDFSITGSARWKPTRVYTDGIKTYIQFPSHLRTGDAPILFIQSQGQQQIVNYRLEDTMMIVDYLVDHAILLSGVGDHQQRVTLERRS